MSCFIASERKKEEKGGRIVRSALDTWAGSRKRRTRRVGNGSADYLQPQIHLQGSSQTFQGSSTAE